MIDGTKPVLGMRATGLRPYPAYRDAGVEWLGKVPEHWEVRRMATVADLRVSNVDKHIREGESPVRLCNYVDVYHNDRIGARVPFVAGTAKEREIRKFRLAVGDVLITKDSEDWSDIGVPALVEYASHDLVCGYHLAMLRPNGASLDGGYLFQALKESRVAWQCQVAAAGVTRYGLSQNAIRSMRVPLPPLTEQTAIARFLDHADRRIRRYIRAKERLVELLEERKRALIHEAVRGRIDVRTGQPYPAYKDSGVEWLGKVPEHWERRRLKTILRVVDRRSSTGEETLLSLRRDHGVVVYSEHFTRPPQGRTLVGYKQLAVGQLVVNRLQANNGLVFCSGVDGLVSPDYSVFDKTAPLQMKYLSDLLRTSAYRSHFRRVSTGLGTGTAGFLRLYDDVFLSTTVFLPPEKEQLSVLEYVAIQVRKIEGLIASAEACLELLDEYRTRLIADVVTGKLDARDAAARLPETDPLADDRDRADPIPTASNLHSTAHEMAKEAIP
ncbi:restriction endonuclease subunit S [Candidatus Palauibacter sp.]|uniref:restriction endonuclease subunit S n=1 Tax=Candidatus Palauibacter sp. TaxID=3101350 RepID=UPI003B5256C1